MLYYFVNLSRAMGYCALIVNYMTDCYSVTSILQHSPTSGNTLVQNIQTHTKPWAGWGKQNDSSWKWRSEIKTIT